MSYPLVSIADVAIINPRPPKDIALDTFVSFIPMASVSEEGFLLNEETKEYKEVKKGFTYFSKEDVLIAKITPCFENGKSLRPFQIGNDIAFGSTEFHVLRANPERLCPKYLFYLLWSNYFRLVGEHAMSGAAGQKRISTDFLKSFKIPLPPLSEQRRISSILDKADELRQKRQQAIKKLDQLLQATFIDMFGDPVINNKKIPTKFLGELGNWSSGGTPTRAEPTYFKGNIPWYTSGELNTIYINESIEKISKLAIDKSSTKLIPVGSLLVGMYDTAAFKSSITTVPSACNQAIAFGQLNSNLVNTLYVYYSIQLSKDSLKKMQRGVRQKNLNLSMVKSISIPVPNIELQNKFSEISTKLLIQRGTLEQSSDKLDSLFKSLQNQAFSGNL